MTVEPSPAGRAPQIALVLAVPVLCMIVGFIFVPSRAEMTAAREGADRAALKDILIAQLPGTARKLDVDLDNTLRLRAARVPGRTLSQGSTVDLDMYFEVLRPTDRDWKIFMHIDRLNGAYRIHGDHAPAEGRYDTSLWRPKELIRDSHSVRIPVDAPAGDYEVWIGLYIKSDRMRFTKGDAALHDGDNRVKIGTLKVQ